MFPLHDLEKRVDKALCGARRILVAVSGGADSTALLVCVHALAVESRQELVVGVAHVDHQLRETSLRDAQFVKQLADGLGISFHLHTVPGERPHANVEAWARTVRYRALEDIRATERYDAVLTAHTANDEIETFLMRILTNKELNLIVPHDERRKVIRPFLGTLRQEIEEYLRLKGHTYISDESNEDNTFLRNRIRNELLPFLSNRFEGNIPRILLERARALAEDHEYLRVLARHHVGKILEQEPLSKGWLHQVRKILPTLPAALQWRCMEELMSPLLSFRVGRVWGERLVSFVLGNAPRIQLPGGATLQRKEGGLLFIDRLNH